MRRARVLLIMMVVFHAGVFGWSAQSEGLSESALATIESAKSREWVAGFLESMETLLRAQPIPRRAMDLVADAIAEDLLPEDPREAAVLFHDAARKADLALRSGTPMLLVRAEVHQRWVAMRQGSKGPPSGMRSKAERALEEAGSESRRSGADARRDGVAGPTDQYGQGGSGR